MFDGGFSVPSHAGLQHLVSLGKGQHLRPGAERAHLGVEHARGLDAHAQSAEVGRYVQRRVGRHHLEAVVPVGQAGDALRLELPQQAAPDAPFGHRVQRRLGREDIRQVEGLEFLHAQRAELGQRRRQHLHRAQLQRFELFLVLVQLAVRIHFDFHASARELLGQHAEAFGGLALRGVGRHHVAELDDDGRLGPGRVHTEGRGERQDQGFDLHGGSRVSRRSGPAGPVHSRIVQRGSASPQ